jgi:hypothetical protein
MQCATHLALQQDNIPTIVVTFYRHGGHMRQFFLVELCKERNVTKCFDINRHKTLFCKEYLL